ncbi:hypothetical protein PpBr36_01485 [Pyricularia pennisetigena]|uniref:hypothetical protein n=1 Tax=Pyricularia pennisetigena TaxID=1578925 RepID=UPI001154C61E|nr:hypothetical protein PpBr36_01485 [Pyricularia pennisetigena]TLS29385.1 hypothetical protein PpBr36_01485 [Pyricularia pennisetigena]
MDETRELPAEAMPVSAPQRRTMGDYVRRVKRSLTTREGLVGNYDYKYLFTPKLPFMKTPRSAAPFFGLNDRMPVLLAMLLGFQHALAMLAGLITVPLLLSGTGGANLPPATQQYLVSSVMIVAGFLSTIQITRFHLLKTPYYLGTGLISVVGCSFAVISVATGGIKQMYASGFCPSSPDGTPLPCPDAYGALLGTAAVCALLEILLSFLPPKVVLRIFPPIVTGPTVMLIGISLVKSGFTNWAGGTGPCSNADPTPFFARCPNINAPHALPWGSAEYLGLGFSVYVTIFLCERFGAPLMQSAAIVIGLAVGCIIAAATGYFDNTGINNAPAVSFIWVQTFKLQVYPPLVLPMLAVVLICMCETIGDITATCDVSRLEVEGRMYESRIQGGVLADGVNSILAAMMTITPMTTYAQNNGVIALTRLFLIIMGVFAKFAAALVAIPAPVLGGMTTFLFSSVAVSGIAIITKGVPFNRRNRFILTAGLALGYGATLVPTYFHNVFGPTDNGALQGFLNAIELIMETGFAVAAFICVVFNLLLPDEVVDEAEENKGQQQQQRGGVASSSSADLSERDDAVHSPSGKTAERGGVPQVVASSGEAGSDTGIEHKVKDS